MNQALPRIPPDLRSSPDLKEQLQKALELHRKRAWSDAKELYERILEAQPDNYDALQLLGVLASETKNYEASVALIAKAIAINPGQATAHSNLGFALKALGRFAESVQSYLNAIQLKPDFADAHLHCGLAYMGMNQQVQAIASFDRVIALRAGDAQAYCNRGVALAKLGHFEEAIAAYQAAISFKPYFPEAYFNWGNALQSLRRHEMAIAAYDQAIAIRADYADAYTNRGNALKELDRHQEAIASYASSILCKPANAQAYLNQGVAYFECLEMEKALACYDAANQMQADYAEAYWNKALALLLSGDLENGFKLHEWRWRRSTFTSKRRDFKPPLWLGEESLQGKTILLHAEQGLGDTIQFCRYCEAVQALGATVLLEVQAPLVGLLASLGGVSRLIKHGDPLPEFDFHCPLMSLPLALKTRLDSIPAAARYLHPNAVKAETWKTRLGGGKRMRIGLAWSGSQIHRNDKKRSIPLTHFIDSLPTGFEYFCLQKEIRTEDTLVLKNSNIMRFESELQDFSDTAALCDLMDLIITVDTSVAHLAGAMGKKVWLLVPKIPDWRWMLQRDDSPWYPSMRILRLEINGHWTSLLKFCGKEISHLEK
jgi:tetratricopeptide (TPR) repeat protein